MNNKYLKGIAVVLCAFLMYWFGGKMNSWGTHGLVSDCDTACVEIIPFIQYDTNYVHDTVFSEKRHLVDREITVYRDTGTTKIVYQKEPDYDVYYDHCDPFVFEFADSSNQFVNVRGQYFYPQNLLEFYYINKFKNDDKKIGRIYVTGGLIGSHPGVGLLWTNKQTAVSLMYGTERIGFYVGYRFF